MVHTAAAVQLCCRLLCNQLVFKILSSILLTYTNTQQEVSPCDSYSNLRIPVRRSDALDAFSLPLPITGY